MLKFQMQVAGFRHEFQVEGSDNYRHNQGSNAGADLTIVLVQLHPEYIYHIILNLDKFIPNPAVLLYKLRHLATTNCDTNIVSIDVNSIYWLYDLGF